MKHSLSRLIGAAVFSVVFTATSVSAQTGVVVTDMLNVRTSPSLSGEVVDALYYGDQVNITYSTGDWYEIYRSGDCYYVNAAYVSGGSSAQSSDYSYDNSGYDDSYNDYSYNDDSYDDGSNTDYGYGDESNDDYSYDNTDTSTTSSGTYLGNFKLTAYCGCAVCCGTAGNPTASGVYPTSGHTVAMGGVPFGTRLMINGNIYTVEDRGTPYGHVDIYFDSHSEALAFGVQYADVYQLD